jgi:hypothetical protein
MQSPRNFALEARRLLTIADRKSIEKRELSNSEPVKKFFAVGLGLLWTASVAAEITLNIAPDKKERKISNLRLEIAAAKRER